MICSELNNLWGFDCPSKIVNKIESSGKVSRLVLVDVIEEKSMSLNQKAKANHYNCNNEISQNKRTVSSKWI